MILDMMKRFLSFFACAVLLSAAAARASSDDEADWRAVLALEAGPQTAQKTGAAPTREEFRALALSHLYKQEMALRAFQRDHPDSRHCVDAQLCLARLYAVRADFSGNQEDLQTAVAILRDGMAAAPANRRADFDFTALSFSMKSMAAATAAQREAFVAQVFTFRQRYPGDRRTAALLAETATLFDADPKRKNEMLKQAMADAQTPEVRARIEDDLRRVSLMGQPVEIRGKGLTGGTMDVANLRGSVVLVYFFASWSVPSLMRLDEVEALRKAHEKDGLAVIGVNLDSSRETVEGILKEHSLEWSVIFDGQGWQSPAVRRLGVNSIPLLWIVDRKGVLRNVNARGDAEPLVQAVLAEK